MSIKSHEIFVFSLVFLFFPSASIAETLLTCGGLSGYSYYYPEQSTKNGSGWQKDGIKNGSTSLVLNDNGVDIVYTDVAKTRSAKEEGATIALVDLTGDAAIVLVSYSGASSIMYHFDLKQKRMGFFMAQYGSAFNNRATSLVANCN